MENEQSDDITAKNHFTKEMLVDAAGNVHGKLNGFGLALYNKLLYSN